jgi:hypothetical protein
MNFSMLHEGFHHYHAAKKVKLPKLVKEETCIKFRSTIELEPYN